MTNDAGGVDGRKLKLISYDDSYDPAKTEACFNRLLEQKVFALAFFVGTPTAVKYLPLAESNKIPLVGLFTGAQTLYVPLRHWVVNVRASYFDETREQVNGLWNTLGYKKVGVIYPDDPFGTTVLEGVKTALKTHGAEPAATGSYQRQTTQAGGATEEGQRNAIQHFQRSVQAGPEYAPAYAGLAECLIELAYFSGWIRKRRLLRRSPQRSRQ
jgi:branched-chain amino acid transport system substrate-binding protein